MTIPITQPCQITVPGDYYLANDITITNVSQLVGGAALYITAAGVRINMNGCKIRGVGLDPNYPSIGIKGEATNNLVLFDGQVGGATGFWCGVFSYTPWTRLQELDLSGNYYMGASLSGHTARLYYNKIDGIAGCTSEPYAIGLNVAGSDSEIRGNTLRNFYKQAGSAGVGEGCAIIINASADNCLVERNWIENDQQCGDTIAIFAGSGGAHTITGNSIIGFEAGIMGGGTIGSPVTSRLNHVVRASALASSSGITCDFGLTEANMIVGYATPLGDAPTGAGNIVLGAA